MSAALALSAGTASESDVVGALLSTIDRFVRSDVDDRHIDRAHAIAPRVLDGLASLGLFGLSLPGQYGGAELSMQAVCSTIAHLARWDRSVATAVGLHAGLGTRGLVTLGSEALKDRYLPDLAAGRKIAAFATTETGAGSDLSAIATTAVRHGDGLLVNGSKAFVTNGGLADVITITASTPDLGDARKGHSLVLLERSDQGLEIGAEEDKLGLRGCSTTPVYLDDVAVSAERIIGRPGAGMNHLTPILAYGRTVMAAGCVGAAQSALAMARQHVRSRVQFGRPIGTFGVVRAQLADMATLAFVAESLVRWTCIAESDEALLLSRSIAAKVFCSEAAWKIADLNVQLHGGSGFIEDTSVPLLLRDARIPRIFEGANDVLLVHAGAIAAQRPRGDAAATGDEVLAKVERHTSSVVTELGVRLLMRQRELHRLGRLQVIAEATRATLARAEADGGEGAKAFCGRWAVMADRIVADALHTDDAYVDAIADALEAEQDR